MSLVDTTFAAIPGQLLADWGQNVTYLKANTNPTYNATTGTVSGADTTLTVRALIFEAKPEEFESVYQASDLKVILGNAELGAYLPSSRDRIQYTQNGSTKTGRIIMCKTSRGENPVIHSILLRPQ
jgi:hypothetical protein